MSDRKHQSSEIIHGGKTESYEGPPDYVVGTLVVLMFLFVLPAVIGESMDFILSWLAR